jgi:hypothetical protein
MSATSRKILLITTALTALSGLSVPADNANAAVPASAEAAITAEQSQRPASSARPNVLLTSGQDLLGLIVTKQPDGTIVAQHSSHASHASHHSHYSSR